MTYHEFKQHIISDVQNALGSDVKVTVQDIIKNNDTHMDGLTILSTQYNLSPTIYLDYYYDRYQKGDSLAKIRQDILTVYHENRPTDSIDISFFTDYDNVKSHIIFKLINYERNSELLKTVPHYRFLDLAIVFNYLLESYSSGNATILIQNLHLDFWGITKDDLYALAFQNTPRLLKYDLRNMTDVLKELFGGGELPPSSLDTDVPCPLYVLSNQKKLNGSVCILYKNLLKELSERLDADLYILPSSIHEVLLLPAKDAASDRELSAMVKNVNASQLSQEEILSDHVYYYSKETCRITM